MKRIQEGGWEKKDHGDVWEGTVESGSEHSHWGAPYPQSRPQRTEKYLQSCEDKLINRGIGTQTF